MKYLIGLAILCCGCSKRLPDVCDHKKLHSLINNNYNVAIFSPKGLIGSSWSIAVDKEFASSTVWCRNADTLNEAIDCVDKKIKCINCCGDK